MASLASAPVRGFVVAKSRTASASRRSAAAPAAAARVAVSVPRTSAAGFGTLEQKRRQSLRCKAEEEPSTPPPAEDAAPAAPKEGDEEMYKGAVKEGQGLAIVTGAISLVLGIGYLFLVAALDRGTMLPPPPEAFGP